MNSKSVFFQLAAFMFTGLSQPRSYASTYQDYCERAEVCQRMIFCYSPDSSGALGPIVEKEIELGKQLSRSLHEQIEFLRVKVEERRTQHADAVKSIEEELREIKASIEGITAEKEQTAEKVWGIFFGPRAKLRAYEAELEAKHQQLAIQERRLYALQSQDQSTLPRMELNKYLSEFKKINSYMVDYKNSLAAQEILLTLGNLKSGESLDLKRALNPNLLARGLWFGGHFLTTHPTINFSLNITTEGGSKTRAQIRAAPVGFSNEAETGFGVHSSRLWIYAGTDSEAKSLSSFLGSFFPNQALEGSDSEHKLSLWTRTPQNPATENEVFAGLENLLSDSRVALFASSNH